MKVRRESPRKRKKTREKRDNILKKVRKEVKIGGNRGRNPCEYSICDEAHYDKDYLKKKDKLITIELKA